MVSLIERPKCPHLFGTKSHEHTTWSARTICDKHRSILPTLRCIPVLSCPCFKVCCWRAKFQISEPVLHAWVGCSPAVLLIWAPQLVTTCAGESRVLLSGRTSPLPQSWLMTYLAEKQDHPLSVCLLLLMDREQEQGGILHREISLSCRENISHTIPNVLFCLFFFKLKTAPKGCMWIALSVSPALAGLFIV